MPDVHFTRSPQPRRAVRRRPRPVGALLHRPVRHGGHRPRTPRERGVPPAAPLRQPPRPRSVRRRRRRRTEAPRGIGLYHLAWQLDTIDELAAARQALLDAGAYSGESSHGATKSLYGADPDGNEFELMWMLPRDEWGPYENAAPIDHLDLAGEVRRWSGVRTAGTVTPDGEEARP